MFDHLITFLWLRWRIRSNQLRNSSAIGKVAAALMLAGIIVSSITMFSLGITAGGLLPRFLPQGSYFLIWDVFSVVFAFVWLTNVMTELQRSDAITMDRILQLPVTYWHAFAVNYLSSLINFPFVCMTSMCIGMIAGSFFSIGPRAMLLVLPCAAFLFAMTAVTYQFQGWLASIMMNPRRRRLVMIAIPFVIIVIVQIPAFFINSFSHNIQKRPMPPRVVAPSSASPVDEGEDNNDSTTQSATLDKASGSKESTPKFTFQNFLSRMEPINRSVPILWLAGSAHSIVEGKIHFLWQSAVLYLIAYLSLKRNYRKTIEFYRGQSVSRWKNSMSSDAHVHSLAETHRKPATITSDRTRLIEWKLPILNESISAVVTMTWQSMLRAPEAKMFLILPFVFTIAMVGVLRSTPLAASDLAKASLAIAGCGFTLLVSSGLMGNQFGFDRTGFRAFVLSPIPRDQILFGKNVAMIPFFAFQVLLLVCGLEWFMGIPLWKFCSSLIIGFSLIPLFSLLFNLMSIVAPYPVASGSIQPKHFDLTPLFFSFILTSLVPFIVGFGMLPILAEFLLNQLIPRTEAIPISFFLSWIFFIVAFSIYRWLMPLEGKLLAKREQEILRIVTSRIE